ncbi:MAG: META domain-containing protein [Limibacillus sp.]|jgi:putative lipoprotein
MRDYLAALAFTLILGAFHPAQSQEMAFLSIKVGYSESLFPPPNSVLHVQLLDTSKADAKAVQLSAQRFKAVNPPQIVRLSYDPALIDKRLSYAVSAILFTEEGVLFRTTSAYPVLTRGASDSIEVHLEKMPERTQVAQAPEGLAGVAWSAFEIGGRALIVDDPPTLSFQEEGRFSLYAGCNRFTGVAEIDGPAISFPTSMAGTRKACPGNREKLEQDTLSVVQDTARYELRGNLLSLLSSAGTVVARFQARPK